MGWTGRVGRTVAIALMLAVPLAAQTRRPARRPAPPPAAAKQEPAEVVCPTPLGTGVTSKLAFCDVMSGRNPADGILIKLPQHRGPVTLTFDLHNRHTYSEEQVKANRAFSRYTATVGVLTMDNTLISRAVVENEFRKVTDLVDRVSAAQARRREGGRADRHRVDFDHDPGGRGAGQHSRREADRRAPGRHRHVFVARPADCDHQQRDDRIPPRPPPKPAAPAKPITGRKAQ